MKKYVVFKVADWDLFMRSEGDPGDIASLLDVEIPDAEVIRHQDITSGPIFAAYAHMMTSFRDLLQSRGMLTEHESGQLQEAADHFHEASIEAECYEHRSLPTP